MFFTSLPTKISEPSFSRYGKCLMLCQAFEHSCEFVLSLVVQSLNLKTGEITIRDIVTNSPAWKKVKKLKIGIIVGEHNGIRGKIINNGYLSEDFLTLLDIAIKSRHWFAHQALIEASYTFIISEETELKTNWNIQLLLKKIDPIIRAHYRLGCIQLEINDKTPYYDQHYEEYYTSRVINWIKVPSTTEKRHFMMKDFNFKNE
ncbi:hypothetical protein M1D52_20405 [Olivibacter sp. SA151]|uniref:hypothetical protein n=1 Tax=Olivibacter jilunii TaxID=985016 RepID=UPI003F13E0CF